MRHLNEDELIDEFYHQGNRTAQRHLEGCEQCAHALALLEKDLAALGAPEPPQRDENYGGRMWARVAAALPARPAPAKPARSFALWRGLGYAAGCAALVAGAFSLGRVWEHNQQQHPAAVNIPAPAAPAPQPKVVVVVLGDHLDRSERLLVELKHADGDQAELAPLRDEARNLLEANRVFRQEADHGQDPALTKALDHLERLLTQLADDPDGPSAAELDRLKTEMNAEGLLFEVRVLRSRDPHLDASVRLSAKGGAV